jgi:predicted transcriptional regulator
MMTDNVPIAVRVPADIIAKLNALATSTGRTRAYWVREALEEIVDRELRHIQEIEEAIAADDADPEEGLTGEEFERWLLDNGLTTREALAAASRRGQ